MLAFIGYGFDPAYFIYVGPAILLVLWAQWRVKSAYAAAGEIPASSRMTGASAARRILDNNSLDDIGIEESQGTLSDHYDPRARVLRLSPDVYHGSSLASVGIAAHEAGHALQEAAQYAPLKLRTGLVPLASTGGSLSVLFIIGGIMLTSMSRAGGGIGQSILMLGIGLFAVTVVFQIVNLPVEFDASRRALAWLDNTGFARGVQYDGAKDALTWAAMTYVAAALAALVQFLYLLMTILGRREE